VTIPVPAPPGQGRHYLIPCPRHGRRERFGGFVAHVITAAEVEVGGGVTLGNMRAAVQAG
jgi:hypothetical protein